MHDKISGNRRLQVSIASRVADGVHEFMPWGPGGHGDAEPQLEQQQSNEQDDSTPSVTFKHPRELLQDTLWPLTHNAQQGSDDLNPHAAPKAKELYNQLLQGLPKPPWYMIDPDGPVRSAWDFLLAVFTIALLIYIPVLIAFYSSALQCVFVGGHTPKSAEEQHAPPQPISAVQFMTLTNMAFLFDIVLNLLTGVRQYNTETGMIEYCYDFKTVAGWYARTWLVLDVVSCLPVECMLGAGGVVHSYNAGHLNRLLKVFGLRRRAHGDPFRLINHIPFIRRNFNYSLRLVVVSASLLLLGLHYFACGLWLVLRLQDFPANTWPVELNLLEPSPNVFQCWTWSVFAVTSAMIGLGYGSYPPQTFPEAVLWTVEMMVMAGGFAAVNGFILAAILELLASKAHYKAKLVQVQREVERRRLPDNIQRKVIRFFELKHVDESVQDGSAFMTELAPGLRLEVALASSGRLLSQVPVIASNQQLLQRAALLIERQAAPEGQLIAIPGTIHDQLLFITRGYADLYMVTDVGEVLIDTLVAGDSFGEASLLPVPPLDQLPSRLQAVWSSGCFSTSSWPVLFSLRALSNCSLAMLDAQKFQDLVQEYAGAEAELHRLGQHHATVLAALPQLEQLWSAAETFKPQTDQPRPFISPKYPSRAARDEHHPGRSRHEGNHVAGGLGDNLRRLTFDLFSCSSPARQSHKQSTLDRKARLPSHVGSLSW